MESDVIFVVLGDYYFVGPGSHVVVGKVSVDLVFETADLLFAILMGLFISVFYKGTPMGVYGGEIKVFRLDSIYDPRLFLSLGTEVKHFS